MLRSTFAFAIAILMMNLTACSDPNPILGVWVVDTDASSTGAQAAAGVAGMRRLEFRENKLVIDNESVDVGYEIDGERVIVTRSAEGRGEVYTFPAEGRMEMALPMGITVVYRRDTGTPPVAAEPEATP